MALAKALGGGFPVGACLATAEAAKGMTAGTHGSTFGGNPLAMAVAQRRARRHARRRLPRRACSRPRCCFKQRLAELKDRHASVIAEVRGEGLLIGLRMVPPASAMVDELRAEKMLALAAGDNVVRLLPPLIISEEEIAEAVGAHRPRLRAACADACAAAKQGGGVMSTSVRHFLDLIDISEARSAGMIDASRAMKAARASAATTPSRSPARRWR